MLQKFIDRPVLSTVISIVITLLGILGYMDLPVSQYPNIAPPTVAVTASYPGASAQTILESVIVPIEEQINGVEGMTYMTSSASNDGAASITVFFEQGIDPDVAAVNVQNRVARANSKLPSEVIRGGVITEKKENSALLYAAIYSENKDYGETFVTNYLNIQLKPELQRVKGVAAVNVFGSRDYSMRIWLDPAKMSTYSLTTADIQNAINEQSLEAAAGALGQNSGSPFEFVIKYKGRYKTPQEYKDIIIRSEGNGRFLRLKDVAEVELDAFSYDTKSITLGHPSVSFGVFQTPGSNAQEVIENLHLELKRLEKTFPDGVKYVINYDTNRFLTASMKKVQVTLIEAFILVFLVVWIFLQDFKSTLIPAIAVPVAIIGTFFFLGVLGYSVNLLTLFALVLAIGIVVDDAIVVVEAVHAKMDNGEEDSHRATSTAMSEISGAIISVTLVMAAVFVPITFIKGPSGVFYEQFGVTLIISILISAVNALTLSPALCVMFLRKHDGHEKKSFFDRFYEVFNIAFDVAVKKYARTLELFLKVKWLTLVAIILSFAGILYFNEKTPSGFVPSEDRGVVFINMELPIGSSLDRTFSMTEEMLAAIKDIPGIHSASMRSGSNFFSGAGSSYALGFVLLKGYDERTTPETSIEGILAELKKRTAHIKTAKTIFFVPPSIPGFGSSDGFELQILDKASGQLSGLDEVATKFTNEIMKSDVIAFASNSFNVNFPQLEMEIDVAKAKESKVLIGDIFKSMQGFIGGYYVADFTRFGKQLRVNMQVKPEDRKNAGSLDNMFVRNSEGTMVQISEFVKLKRSYGPQSIKRFNLYNAVSVNGGVMPGHSSGEAIKEIDRIAAETLPMNYEIAYSGLTREEISSSGQSVYIFMLSILFTYLFLAAQYESYVLPFAVLFSLPFGVLGAYSFTYWRGLENNIYFQIAMIMLVGLLAKNAILIIEFALQRRNEGYSLYDAAIEGAKERIRPILMTSFAFILGLTPLVMAEGVGAAGNKSIGTGAMAGMLVGTLLGLIFIPVLFVVFQGLHEKIVPKRSHQKRKKEKLEHA
ncbi:efflux RND transporter permease subunit [Flammeovirga yaeyamensis]|uniref:Efflux RND transporter permease subunit n=1 Tax=Flammeovirga yaeyamensis TaxID=367791 RepID=A0AAX1NAF4_9BACT|nr:efflux RND transporter permease subunit [Flammeovirga yaeyamensis]MBB3699399.1 HAE1 family hydrophobic/amphiphilic exporter-1 [Flammeovirga yaeyamensis]NMF35342.1 efflux RND transporter permease subunit [Flammeovirga yaeyamensis]QWG04202.1 efflux RND transporter permease subunit [Flammeovirga yaeyamensis]